MARPSLTTIRARLLAGSALLAVAIPTTAWAAMAVLDSSNLAQAAETVKELRKQAQQIQEQIDLATQELAVINEISEEATRTVDAIGEATTLTLPVADLLKLGSQLERDVQCLLPNLEELYPEITFQGLDWTGICGASAAYRDILFVEPGDPEAGRTFLEADEAQKTARHRRVVLLEEAALKGAAGGDIANLSAQELLDASEELRAAADRADDMNDRLAVIAQGQVLTAQALAQQNQILAQLLKLQSARVVHQDLPVTEAEALASTEEDTP